MSTEGDSDVGKARGWRIYLDAADFITLVLKYGYNTVFKFRCVTALYQYDNLMTFLYYISI